MGNGLLRRDLGACAGEDSVRVANAKRFHERCQRDFEAFRKERLASGELECQKLINAAQAHLTQVTILQGAAWMLLTSAPDWAAKRNGLYRPIKFCWAKCNADSSYTIAALVRSFIRSAQSSQCL